MISVWIGAEHSDQHYWNAVRRMLCAHYPAVIVRGRELFLPRGDARMVVADLGAFGSTTPADSVLLLSGCRKIDLEGLDESRSIAVVDSSDKGLLTMLAGTKLPAITCGLSPRDTITLSSIDVDAAVINLQRSVSCFDGSVAEPQEIPVRLRAPIDNFALMSLSCVFILCGEIDRLSETLL